MEAQKTNEDLISEGHKRIEQTAEKICDCGLHEEIGDVFKEILKNALTLKDEAHKKEMEEEVREAKERIRGHIAEWDRISESESEFADKVRYYFRDFLTPTKEATEELPTNH